MRVRPRCIRTMKTSEKGRDTERWNQMFHRLTAYKEKHQTTDVPKRWKEDPQLNYWVATQRKSYRKEMISKHRMDRLNSIGFVWNVYDAQWMEMYQKLMTYKEQHKSTSVPRAYKADTALAAWVNTQRKFYKNKTISVEHMNYLECIGFVWKLRDLIPWIEMFERLVAYKQRYQSTLVPFHFTEDPRLGHWVSVQRIKCNKSKLSEKRIELLNSIEFFGKGKR